MRLLLPVAVLALLVAGCAAADDPAPPNADPNGPAQTLPPASASNSTSPTGVPSTPPKSSTSSSTYGAGFAPHSEEESAGSADFTGLAVNGRLAGAGDALWIEASANKFSPASYRVPDGQCVQPWTEALLGPNGPVQPRRPVPTCTAFGLRPMQDNEAISIALEWDGTLWDGGQEKYVPAPAGQYVWQATFHVYSGGVGAQYNESAELALAFEVTVP